MESFMRWSLKRTYKEEEKENHLIKTKVAKLFKFFKFLYFLA